MNFPTSQTPPPPSPYPQSTPPAAEPTGPGLSEAQRLINIFIAPKKTFEDLKRNPSWWVPWLISAVFSLIFGFVAVQKIDMAHMVQQRIEQSPSAQKRMEQLPPQQREQAMALQATITKVTFFMLPIFSLISGLIIAAVLMVVFNFLMGAEVPFQRAMAIVFYAFVPGILATILLTVSILVSSDPNTIDFNTNPMPTNPGFFMDPQGNKFIYGVASGLDIFRVWLVVLLGLGFAAASSNRKPSVSTGLVTMFVIYAIIVLGGAAIRAAF
jgi:hypothetical protein